MSRVRIPLGIGIAAKGLGLLILLPFAHGKQAALLIAGLSAACALAMPGPVSESLMAVSIPAEERARANAIMVSGILLAAAPVTFFAGILSEINRALPLIMRVIIVFAEALAARAIIRTSP